MTDQSARFTHDSDVKSGSKPARHNSRLRLSTLPLSVGACSHGGVPGHDCGMAGCGPRTTGLLPITEVRSVGAGGRLTHTAARFVALRGGRAPRAHYPVELIAREIRDHRGDVWPSVQHFGISYEHALRIRNGWRGAGKPRAKPVEWYRSRNVGRRTPAWALQP